jgi:hypothetical protein
MNALIEAVESWAAALPKDGVKVTFPPIPADDDYGLEKIIACEPLKPGACPLEVGITAVAGEAAPSAYVCLDTWGAIARRTQLRVAAQSADWIGLFWEPTVMSAERLRQVCSAVAAGGVRLEVGAWRGKLAWTTGVLELPGGPLQMRGPRTRLPFARLLSRIGVVRTISIAYEPWI